MIVRLFLLVVIFALLWFFAKQESAQAPGTNTPAPTQREQTGSSSAAKAPAHALKVLRYVRENGRAPDNFVGGREFLNREKRLPLKTPDGKKIRYSEWDVHPKIKGQNRGPERLVTGSDHSAYYTKDHYKTFLKID